MTERRGLLSRLDRIAERHRLVRFLAILILFGVPTLIALTYVYMWDEHESIRSLMARERYHLRLQRQTMDRNFLKVLAHLSELSHDSRILKFLDRPDDPERRETAANAILTLCRVRNIFKRITLVSRTGEVVMRVWDLDGPPELVHRDTLRPAGREAFEATRRLPTGEILLNDFEMNLAEFGRGTKQIHLLRFGRMLFGADGVELGAIFLNYEFDDIVRDADLALSITQGGFSIADETGRLLNSDRSLLTEPLPGQSPEAHIHRGVERFQDIYPRSWEAIQHRHRGDLAREGFARRLFPGLFPSFKHLPDDKPQVKILGEGIFTWERIYPFRSLRLLENETLFETAAFESGEATSHHWILISRVDRASYDEYLRPLRDRYRKIAGILFLTLCVVSALLANYLHRRIESEKELRQTLDLLDRELDLSRSVLESIMPKGFHDLPEVDAAHAYLPSNKVGGDFFDLFAIGPRKIAFFLFDMSGHGVPAALGTLLVRACFVRHLRETECPSAALALANDELQNQLGEDHFLTAFAAVIDLEARVLKYASAGAPPPFFLRDGALPVQLTADGPLLGVLPGVSFHEERREVAPGDRLVLYTDGFVEARDPRRRMYSTERLAALLAGRLPDDAAGIRTLLVEDLREFTRCEDRFVDDVTLLVIKLV